VIQDRYEILIYTSSALTEPIHLFGQPKLKVMYQVLNGPTDLVAILSIVSHSGARFISIGRAEIASDHHTEGQWKSIEIDLRHVGVQIKVGEMLRLELTGSAFPLFSRHPNGASENIHTIGTEGLNIATVAISSKAKSSSWLELPIKRAE
jgi:predicted acyl esterase